MIAPHRDVELMFIPIDPGFQGNAVVIMPTRVKADHNKPDQWGAIDEVKELLREAGYSGVVMIDLEEEDEPCRSS